MGFGTDLWKKLTRSKETTEILPTDIVVFIVGPTGSGKSWLLSELVKKGNIQFSKQSLKPSTKEVNAVRCHFSGDNRDDIVIVDTPSFHTYLDPDGEVTLKQWINEKCKKSCKGAGILYLHNIAANPHDANLSMSKHLQAFNRAYTSVSSTIVVPTLDKGVIYPPDKAQRLTLRLQSEAEKFDAITCKLFDGQPETAWEIVQELLKQMGYA